MSLTLLSKDQSLVLWLKAKVICTYLILLNLLWLFIISKVIFLIIFWKHHLLGSKHFFFHISYWLWRLINFRRHQCRHFIRHARFLDIWYLLLSHVCRHFLSHTRFQYICWHWLIYVVIWLSWTCIRKIITFLIFQANLFTFIHTTPRHSTTPSHSTSHFITELLFFSKVSRMDGLLKIWDWYD